MRTLIVAISAALAASALAAGAASASTYDDYVADGQLPACQYDPSQLQGDLDSAPSDIRQYDPGYLEALRRALNARARGACDPETGSLVTGDATGAGRGGGRSGDGSPRPEAVVASGSAIAVSDLRGDAGIPGWATALGLFGALLAAAAAAFTFAFARQGLRAHGPQDSEGSLLSDYWWAMRERLGR